MLHLAPLRLVFGTPRRIGLVLGSVATLAVVLTIDGPGMTVDEPLDVRPGRTYVATLMAKGWRFFSQGVSDGVYRDNCEHPPLGRWLLGIASTLGEPAEFLILGPDPLKPRLYIRAARMAPALAFGLLVGVVASTATRRFGRVAGVVAGFALLAMPRAFAHAHIAALDTFVTCFWTLAFLGAARAVESARPVCGMAGAGVLWALALLTKIHAWLLPLPVVAWALMRLPWRRGVPAIVLWGTVGLAVFFVGWPWLWFDPIGRLSAYLQTGVKRTPIRVQYFGAIYVDRDVPWHYPWVYFAATVPVGLHVLGALGARRGLRDRAERQFTLLLLATILGWLLLFSTRVPVYDGERLFYPAFPLWALLIGRGAEAAWNWTADRRWAKVGLVGLVVAQAWGVASMNPFGLSYYNALVGGVKGAESLGLELTYWGDAVDNVLLDELASRAGAGESAALIPTLAQDQGLVATTRRLVARDITLGDQEATPHSEWLVIYRRPAYWPPQIAELVRSRPPVATRTKQGVWLSGLWRRE